MPVCERAGMGETWRRAAGAVACGARRRMDRAPLVMLAATCPPAARLCCTGPRGRLVYAPSPLQSCPLSPALTPPPPPRWVPVEERPHMLRPLRMVPPPEAQLRVVDYLLVPRYRRQ